MANIHGWRCFSYGHCSKTGTTVLVGSAGMHLHNRVQKVAECSGISSAMWMTETARERLEERQRGGPQVPHEGPAPDWDCSCGAYFFRLLSDAAGSDMNAYAHVTCLERTMLHANGGRTTQYAVDYLLAPAKPNQKVYVPVADPSQVKTNQALVPMGIWGIPFGGVWMGVEREAREVLEEISLSLGVPILEKEDISGCPICIQVNRWRESEEISEEMVRSWFGEGYRQHERDEKWKESLEHKEKE